MLLTHGAEIERKDRDSSTALWFAVINNHRAVVSLLVDYGPDADSRDNGNGETLTLIDSLE